MNKVLLSIIALVSLTSGHANAEVYSYTGSLFSAASGVYTNTMRITGSITTSVPIPLNSIDFNIATIATSWSFSDGVQTITSADGVNDAQPSVPVRFDTDGAGNITAALIWFYDDPITTVIGGTNKLIGLFDNAAQSFASIVATCVNLSSGVCENYTLGPDSGGVNALSGEVGAWVTGTLPVDPMIFKDSFE